MAVPVYTVKISTGITSSSVANPSVITTSTAHGFVTGTSVTISGHTSVTPDINSTYTATVTGATTFTIPVNVTDGGVGGRVTAVRDVLAETMEINATENQPDTARVSVLSAGATYRPIKGQEIVIYEDATALFGGLIRRVLERGLGHVGTTAIVNEIEAVSFKRFADYRYVTETIPAQILKTTLTTIVTNYLTGFGVTLHGSQVNGPSLDSMDPQNLQATAFLNQLAELSGYTWNIDESKKLRFTAPGSTTAPYDVTTANGKALGDVSVEMSEQDYANRVLVKAGSNANGLVEKTQSFTGDGATTTFNLNYQIAGPYPTVASGAAGYGVVDYNGSESIATDPKPTGYVWEHDPAGGSYGTIERSSAPANLDTFSIRMQVQFPITVTVQDTGEQASRGYIVERVIDAPDVFDYDVATTIGTNELAKAIAQARTVKYVTNSTGAIRPGQSQTITISARNNINTTCTVTEVRTRHVRGSLVRRDVTAVEGTSSVTPVYRGVVRSWLGGNASTSSGAGVPVVVSSPATSTQTPSLYEFTYLYVDANIKALPTTALTVLPAPGSGYIWHVVKCVVMVDASDAAYTNVNAAAFLQLDCLLSSYLGNNATFGMTQVTDLFTVANHQYGTLEQLFSSEVQTAGTLAQLQAAQWGPTAEIVPVFSTEDNSAVKLSMNNGGSGNLTGGHANNRLRTLTYAAKLPNPSLW